MTLQEHNTLVTEINEKFTKRSKELGIESVDLAQHMVGIWTNGDTDYLRWFGDRSFDCVIKPNDLNLDSMSEADIEAAVRAERAAIIREWLPKMDTLVIDSSESGAEVSVEPAKTEPEPEPTAETEPTEAPSANIASAVAKLMRKKAEPKDDMLGPIGERVDTLESRLDATEGQVGTLVTNTQSDMDQLKEAVKILSGRLKKAEGDLSALLQAIDQL